MSACAQVMIAFMLIVLQLGIIIALFVMEPPEVNRSLSSYASLSLLTL